MKDIELVSFEFEGPHIFEEELAGTNLLKDVKINNLNEGAICSNVPGKLFLH